MTRTGFLTDYDRMAPTAEHTMDLVWVNPALVPSRYHAVIIEPVVWFPGGDAPTLEPDAVTRVTGAFNEALTRAFGARLRVVDRGDCGRCEDVLRVRAAVTNVRRSRWYLNVPTRLAGVVAGGLIGVPLPLPPPAPGGASVELEALDAATGETLAAAATFKNGMPWNPIGQVLPYAHAERAFDHASRLLLDQVSALP